MLNCTASCQCTLVFFRQRVNPQQLQQCQIVQLFTVTAEISQSVCWRYFAQHSTNVSRVETMQKVQNTIHRRQTVNTADRSRDCSFSARKYNVGTPGWRSSNRVLESTSGKLCS